MHMYMINDVVELRVGFPTVLADQKLVRPARLIVWEEPLDIAKVQSLRVEAFIFV